MNLLIIIISLYISITIHELGHYLAFKAFNVPVKLFCIGSGPRLFTFKKFNTNFIFKLLPVDGKVVTSQKDIDKIIIFKEWIILLSGITLNLLVSIICSSIISNKSIFVASKIFFTKIFFIPTKMIFNILNYFGSEVALSSTLPEAINTFQSNQFLLVLITTNILLFWCNLLPLPFTDGGNLIISIIRRWANKSPKRAHITKKIIYITNLLFWILLLSPIFINEALKFISALEMFLLIIIGILFSLLLIVIKQTEIYKNIIKK